jgi:hypothetical protein
MQRWALAVEVGRLEHLLNDPATTATEVVAVSEELRTLRTRLHAIDRQLAEGAPGNAQG